MNFACNNNYTKKNYKPIIQNFVKKFFKNLLVRTFNNKIIKKMKKKITKITRTHNNIYFLKYMTKHIFLAIDNLYELCIYAYLITPILLTRFENKNEF